MRGWLEGDPISVTLDASDLHGPLLELEERFARHEPAVQAFLPEKGRFARLHRQADEAMAAFPDWLRRDHLFGVPIGVKDVLHVDGFVTRAGSRLPPEELAGPEAEVITRLRAKGVLFAGKTVATEFAWFSPGPTRNPHNLEHTPGGSSSGSAAAVAAGLCPVALGTQTIGSIIRPAAYCGVVGFKPSYGRVSTRGVIPLAPSLDHVGLFAPNVMCALALAVTLIPDHESSIGNLFTQPVLGIPEGPYLSRASAEGLEHFRETCDWLSARYRIRSVPAMPDFEKIVARHSRLLAGEAARVHQDWFARHRELYSPRMAELIERGQAVTPDMLKRDRAGRKKLRDQLTTLMDEHRIDLWLSPPATGPAPRGLDGTGDPIMNLPWTYAGLPTMTVPAGRSADGLPMGLQLTGRWWKDEDLLHWAHDIAEHAAS